MESLYLVYSMCTMWMDETREIGCLFKQDIDSHGKHSKCYWRSDQLTI